MKRSCLVYFKQQMKLSFCLVAFKTAKCAGFHVGRPNYELQIYNTIIGEVYRVSHLFVLNLCPKPHAVS